MKGFTIIELIIVVAIVALMSTMVVVRFTRPNAEDELANAQAIYIADIRRVVSYAQTGRIDPGTGSAPLGYGIRLYETTDTYDIYADYNGNFKYDALSDVIVDSMDLSQDELINNVTLSSCTPGAATCDMQVLVSSGDIYTNGVQNNNLNMTLQHARSSDSLTIQFDLLTGQIN